MEPRDVFLLSSPFLQFVFLLRRHLHVCCEEPVMDFSAEGQSVIVQSSDLLFLTPEESEQAVVKPAKAEHVHRQVPLH